VKATVPVGKLIPDSRNPAWRTYRLGRITSTKSRVNPTNTPAVAPNLRR
jgi:hypothetical protein